MSKKNNIPKSELKDLIHYTADKGPTFGARHVQVLMMAVGTGLAFCTKSMLSVAIVAMTDNTTSSNPDVPTYHWNNKSVIVSSILWSGIAVNLLAGYLGKQYGPKWFVVGASAFNSLFFMLIPWSTELWGSTGVIVCRLFQGVALGFIFPLASVVLGRWVPPEERSRMGFVGSGFLTLFLTIGSTASGYIAQSYLGWPWIFYIIGMVELTWTLCFIIVGVQSADVHKSITPEEKKYIDDTLFQTSDNEKTPWLQIVKSIHFWAVIVGITGFNFIVIMLSTEMSIFLAKVMDFDIQTNGAVSAIPPLTGAISGAGFSVLSDYISKKGIMSVINSRRTFHIIGITGVSLSLIGMTFIPVEQKAWSVVLLCIGNIFVLGAGVGGASINILDVSPKYAGIIMGCAQMFSQIVSLFAPLLVQWICIPEGDASKWRIVFLISAVLCISTAVFFAIFATDQRQEWETESEEEAQIEVQKRKASVISISAGIGP